MVQGWFFRVSTLRQQGCKRQTLEMGCSQGRGRIFVKVALKGRGQFLGKTQVRAVGIQHSWQLGE